MKAINLTPLRTLKSDHQDKSITGFSRLNKAEKLEWVTGQFFTDADAARVDFASFWHPDAEVQRTLDGFSENTISNYVLPYGIAPNFLIDGQVFTVPMVIEESSVVAAAASAAKFWLDRGGFHTEIVDTVKLGQVHFRWSGRPGRRTELFDDLRHQLLNEVAHLTSNMRERGGGVLDLEWLHLPELAPD